jgi:hypothetical protein
MTSLSFANVTTNLSGLWDSLSRSAAFKQLRTQWGRRFEAQDSPSRLRTLPFEAQDFARASAAHGIAERGA